MSTSTSSRLTTQKGKTLCLLITSLILLFYNCISSGVSVASCYEVNRGGNEPSRARLAAARL